MGVTGLPGVAWKVGGEEKKEKMYKKKTFLKPLLGALPKVCDCIQ